MREDSILWHFHSCCILLHLVANGCSDHFLGFENRQAAQLAKRTKRQAALSLRQLFPNCFTASLSYAHRIPTENQHGTSSHSSSYSGK